MKIVGTIVSLLVGVFLCASSLSAAGGKKSAGDSAISADGRFVAFTSSASDLVANDTNGASDVFVFDLKKGTTALVSVNLAGTGTGNGGSFGPVISPDGRFVAFVSGASDLIANDTNGKGDVFVRDLKTGTTTLASVNHAGTNGGNGRSDSPVLSADGRFVAFQSLASDLVANDTNVASDVFVRDLKKETTTLVSVNLAGTDSGLSSFCGPPSNEQQPPLGSISPSISADGRFVAFWGDASDLVANGPPPHACPNVFVRDLKRDTTTLVGGGRDSSISADGRFVVFAFIQVFVYDLKKVTTTLVSVNQAGTNSGNGGSRDASISADGRFVAFVSLASDLVANDTNGQPDVFLFDLKKGTTTLVSINQAGTDSGNGQSSSPVISADGRFVTFQSSASDLVATGTTADGFVRDLRAGTTTPLP